jgi:hypothetical protein
MRPTLEPSVRSDEIFPYYWNRTQNASTPPQNIAGDFGFFFCRRIPKVGI